MVGVVGVVGVVGDAGVVVVEEPSPAPLLEEPLPSFQAQGETKDEGKDGNDAQDCTGDLVEPDRADTRNIDSWHESPFRHRKYSTESYHTQNKKRSTEFNRAS